jgi:prephenate dehydrogenase
MVYDIDQGKSRNLVDKYSCLQSESLEEICQYAESILICTPIKTIPSLISKICKSTNPGTMVVEISSLKKKCISALKKHKDVIKPLSIHPMFGSDITGFEDNTIIVVPVANRELEMNHAIELFPGSEIIVADEDTHDKSMAFILSLPYFMNIVFAKCLPGENLGMIRKLAGPTFKAQLALTQSIAGEDPVLIESLIDENVFAGDLINSFIDELKYLRRMLKSKPWKVPEYCNEIAISMMQDPEFNSARKIRDKYIENQNERLYQ